ncbi:MAG: hypothetical protein J0I19_13695 [Alphaproteobacteria bacterium]|nr:hypothetical protein [Alphaproteobacteria bacterium]
MIPKWQMTGLFILVALLAGFAIYMSPNSYAYAFLSGQCSRDPLPTVCHRFTGARGGAMRSAW